MKPTQKSLAVQYLVIFAILAMDQDLITAAENSGQLHEIVRGATPASTIVIAEAPSPSAQLAAIEVQYAIEKMTGVTIPIVNDNQDVAGKRIVIGDNAVTRRLGLKADGFSQTEHLVEVGSELIVLYGRDAQSSIGKIIDFHKVTGRSGELPVRLPGMYEPQGSLRAAYHFLDRMLGVRYYGPRDYQCHFPERKSLTVSATRVQRAPAMKYTNGLSSDQGSGVAWPIQKILYDDPTTEEVLLFARRLGTGGKPWYVNHTYEHLKYKARFGKEPDPRYPEIHEGYRAEFWPPIGSPSHQLCYSSEALARQVAKDAADYFDGKLSGTPHGLPVQDMDVFPVVPNDAGNYCTCDRCREFLAPHKKRKLHGVFGEGTATDYVFNFANMVARHLRKTHPDKTIAVLAYEGYIWEPVSIELEPNVVGAPCIITCAHWHRGQHENDWKAYEFWAQQAKRNGLPFYLWNYYHHPEEIGAIHKHKVFPQFTPSMIHEWSKRYKRDGVEGVFLCGWGEGLDFYVLMKSFNDPDFELDAVLNEYFTIAVGSEAAPHLRKFHDLIESISFDRRYFSDAINERVFWELQGTKEHLDALEAHLRNAELGINPKDKLAQRRFAPWRRLLEYMKEGHMEWKAKKQARLGKNRKEIVK